MCWVRFGEYGCCHNRLVDQFRLRSAHGAELCGRAALWPTEVGFEDSRQWAWRPHFTGEEAMPGSWRAVHFADPINGRSGVLSSTAPSELTVLWFWRLACLGSCMMLGC